MKYETQLKLKKYDWSFAQPDKWLDGKEMCVNQLLAHMSHPTEKHDSADFFSNLELRIGKVITCILCVKMCTCPIRNTLFRCCVQLLHLTWGKINFLLIHPFNKKKNQSITKQMHPFIYHQNKFNQKRTSYFPLLILEIRDVWMHSEEEHNFHTSPFYRWNACIYSLLPVVCIWTVSFSAVIWRVWTCAAAAALCLLDMASEPSRWACSLVVRSKACGPHLPVWGSLIDQRAQPHLEPKKKKSSVYVW